jgi:protein SCO1/2
VQKACRAYRVFYQNTNETKEGDEDYLVDHSIISYLIGPDGKFIDFFTQNREIDEIVSTISTRIKDKVGSVAPKI